MFKNLSKLEPCGGRDKALGPAVAAEVRFRKGSVLAMRQVVSGESHHCFLKAQGMPINKKCVFCLVWPMITLK